MATAIKRRVSPWLAFTRVGILKGEKAADLPILAAKPSSNWSSTSQTAKALGLDIPDRLLAQAERRNRVRQKFVALRESVPDAVDGSSTGT